MQWTMRRFPHLDRQLRELASRHLELRDEPLHLALTYDPGRDSGDVFLLEVLGNFGFDEVSEEKELFEVTFEPTQDLTLEPGRKLHLLLTNTNELRTALEDHWDSAEEVRDAIRKGDFEVLHQDEIGSEVMRWFDE